MFISIPSFAGTLAETLPGTNLAALEAIEKSGLYRVQVFTREVEGHREAVVLLGETHMKTGEASRLGKDFLNGFYGDVGVEGVDWNQRFLGQSLRSVIYAMHEVIGTAVFGSDRQPSTILDAITMPNPPHDPDRRVLRLEQGHRADWMENASLWVLTAVLARTLAEGGVRLSFLAVAGAKNLGWVVMHPSQVDWKKIFSIPRLPKIPLKTWARSMGTWVATAPRRSVTALAKAPCRCGEAILQFLTLSPQDPTRDFPLWKRVAFKADEGLRYTFLGLIGGNIYLYLHPGIPLGLLNGRNEDMVQNALLHLDTQIPPPDRADTDDRQAPNPRPFLVIEGIGHLSGWGYLLRQKGFERAL